MLFCADHSERQHNLQMTSENKSSDMLLVTQGFDAVEVGGADGGGEVQTV